MERGEPDGRRRGEGRGEGGGSAAWRSLKRLHVDLRSEAGTSRCLNDALLAAGPPGRDRPTA